MGIVTEILRFTLHACSLALLVYWGIGLFRLLQARAIPTATAGLRAADRSPPGQTVCVVVPAHNEAAIIGRLVESLRAQDHPRLSVVLCLDRCTDRTAEVAEGAIGGDPRFEIIPVEACPADWAGKVHAIWAGVQRSAAARSADLLLFADADTRFHPSCVRATAALLQERGLDMLSLLSTLTADRTFERVEQPAAAMELLTQYPIHRANDQAHQRAFANGQFILVRREAYEALGGHAAVRDELLEDMALARLAADRRLRAGVFVADGLLACRMYDSREAFRRGWKRIYTEAAKRRVGRLDRAAWRLRVFGVAFVLAAAVDLAISFPFGLEGRGWWHASLPAFALAVWLAVVLGCYRMQRVPLWAAPAYPLGAWRVASIIAEAAGDLRRRTPTSWAGREYVREVR